MNVRWPIKVSLESPFPLCNIPYGVFSTITSPTKRIGTRVGEFVLDLAVLESHGYFQAIFEGAEPALRNPTNQLNNDQENFFAQSYLNSFAMLPSRLRKSIRSRIINVLEDGNSSLFTDQELNIQVVYNSRDIQMHLPMQIGDFTDFMGSRIHVENCSSLINTPPPPNFYSFPPAYNGRASSIIVSGTSFPRPKGMVNNNNYKTSNTSPRTASTSASAPTTTFAFSPSQRFDYELELGCFISTPVPFGEVITNLEQAREHIFGFVLLNDWSARDVQFAEMTPLGPFNGKGSATTISPWVVTLDALEGAECAVTDVKSLQDMVGRPNHLRHLDNGHQLEEAGGTSSSSTWDIEVQVWLGRARAEVEKGSEKLEILGKSNLKELYWSPLQMLGHHASSGCGLRTGDLLGTGTISSSTSSSSSLKGQIEAEEGDGMSSLGCLFELTGGGKRPVRLKNGEEVLWLKDNDEVVMRGEVKLRDGSVLGFGDCRGVLYPTAP